MPSGDIVVEALRFSRICGKWFKVRLGPAVLVLIGDAETTHEVLTKPANDCIKSPNIQNLWKIAGNGLPLISNPDIHRHARKILSQGFRGLDQSQQNVNIFNECASRLVDYLRELNGNTPVAALPLIQRTTLEAVVKVSTGRDVNILNGSERWLGDSFCALVRAFGMRIIYFMPIAEPLVRFAFRKDIERVHNFLYNIIDESEKNPEDAPPILSVLLEAKKNGSISRTDTLGQLLGVLIGGHESMSSLLAYAFGALAYHTHVQQKVYDEIMRICGNKEFEASDADKLREVDAWLLESLRMWPPFAILARTLTKDWTMKDGVELPAGTQIFMMANIVHRDETTWDDPDTFNPDRFDRSLSVSYHQQQHRFVPFGRGARGCIGDKYFWCEAKALAVALIRAFEVKWVEGESTLDPVLGQTTLRPQKDMVVRFCPRPGPTISS